MAIIVTAELDSASFRKFDALRREHSPVHLNFLSAHVTLFHKLSDEQAKRVADTPLPPIFPVTFSGVRFLGRGVAVSIASPELMALRAELRRSAGGMFTRQDDQPFKPHITIQNKVEPSVARQLFDDLLEHFEASTGSVIAVQLWRYLGGPWELVRSLPLT